MTKEFNDQNFDQEVIKSNKIVLVDFWAPWCGSCQVLGPIIDELAKEFKGKVEIGKMSVEKNTKIPEKLGIMSVPSIKIFKNGEEVQEFTQLQAKETLKNALENLLK